MQLIHKRRMMPQKLYARMGTHSKHAKLLASELCDAEQELLMKAFKRTRPLKPKKDLPPPTPQIKVPKVRYGDDRPEWHTLPVRVQRLLMALASLSKCQSLTVKASYADLQPYITGARPQVPQTIKAALALGVVAHWGKAKDGANVFLYVPYPEAMAWALAAASGQEVSVATIEAARGENLLLPAAFVDSFLNEDLPLADSVSGQPELSEADLDQSIDDESYWASLLSTVEPTPQLSPLSHHTNRGISPYFVPDPTTYSQFRVVTPTIHTHPQGGKRPYSSNSPPINLNGAASCYKRSFTGRYAAAKAT